MYEEFNKELKELLKKYSVKLEVQTGMVIVPDPQPNLEVVEAEIINEAPIEAPVEALVEETPTIDPTVAQPE